METQLSAHVFVYSNSNECIERTYINNIHRTLHVILIFCFHTPQMMFLLPLAAS